MLDDGREHERAHAALNITRRCNQRCVFCFEGERPDWPEMSLADVEAMLDAAVRRGVRMVVFMGAEALLRPDIAAVEAVRARVACLGLHQRLFGRASAVDELSKPGFVRCCHSTMRTPKVWPLHAPAGRFERLLMGLRAVHEHNRRFPARAVGVGIQTQLFVANDRRLGEIRRLLEEVLEEDFLSQTIGVISPSPGAAASEPLLEPLAGRREELADYLGSWDRRRFIRLSKVPLCMVPGFEHLSKDVEAVGLGGDISSNFTDKRVLGPMDDPVAAFRHNPYRWVCCRCLLLPLCPTTRTAWGSSAFAPDRDQRPIPVLDRAPEDVLARLGCDRSAAARRLKAASAAKLAVPLPERVLFDIVASRRRVRHAFLQREPLFRVELDGPAGVRVGATAGPTRVRDRLARRFLDLAHGRGGAGMAGAPGRTAGRVPVAAHLSVPGLPGLRRRRGPRGRRLLETPRVGPASWRRAGQELGLALARHGPPTRFAVEGGARRRS